MEGVFQNTADNYDYVTTANLLISLFFMVFLFIYFLLHISPFLL